MADPLEVLPSMASQADMGFKLVGGFKHFLFSIIQGMSSFPLTFILFKMVIAPPTRQKCTPKLWMVDLVGHGWTLGPPVLCSLGPKNCRDFWWGIWFWNQDQLEKTWLSINLGKLQSCFFFQGNHPKMAQHFRLVNYYHWPRWIMTRSYQTCVLGCSTFHPAQCCQCLIMSHPHLLEPPESQQDMTVMEGWNLDILGMV